MKKRHFLSGLFLIIAFAFFTQSCSKDDEGNLSETDIILAQDESYMDALFDEVDNLALTEIKLLDDNEYVTSDLKSTFIGACYTVTVNHPDTTTFPKEVIIDFGESCSIVFNGDTITRSGQIIINISNRWFIKDAQQVITFNNFYFNGAKVEGTRTMTNNGLNELNRMEIYTQLVNGKVTFSEGAYMTRTANHVREWSRKMNPLNDTIYVTGSANGSNVFGETYSRAIMEPLIIVRCPELQYRWAIAAGTIEISNSARGKMIIEHMGNGCSGDVVVEKDGIRYNYQFRYRYRNNDNTGN